MHECKLPLTQTSILFSVGYKVCDGPDSRNETLSNTLNETLNQTADLRRLWPRLELRVLRLHRAAREAGARAREGSASFGTSPFDRSKYPAL